MEKELLTINETASLLGVSLKTLRRWDAAGKLKAVRTSPRGHRHYRKQDLGLLTRDPVSLAELWIMSEDATEMPSEYYCQTIDVFRARLTQLDRTQPPLIVSVVGEIGNNSFDHNLGNWRDVPGIFLGLDENRKKIVLADRGQGILATLKHVRPGLSGDLDALKVAFTEIITGRAPEHRGNGLKFVRKAIISSSLQLVFRSGTAELELRPPYGELMIKKIDRRYPGCFAVISY